jgi:hypothetical protein
MALDTQEGTDRERGQNDCRSFHWDPFEAGDETWQVASNEVVENDEKERKLLRGGALDVLAEDAMDWMGERN